MNILTAAGIAQINEPIFPQNGERIFGGLGKVTFNQASQYIEEPNPDAPITPPDCVNCSGGIPPEVPPEEPQIIYQCLSNCPEPFNYFIVETRRPIENQNSTCGVELVSSSTNFNLYYDALNYMFQEIDNINQALFKEYFECMKNRYVYEGETYKGEIISSESPQYRYANINFNECYDITIYDDLSKDEIIKAYDAYTYNPPVQRILKCTAIINYKETNKVTGVVKTYTSEITLGNIRFYRASNYCSNCCNA